MKLSDVRGERTLDVIADVIEPIANIAEDENAAMLFKREKLPDGEDPKKFLMKRVRKHLPALLKEHKDDLIAILAAVEDVSAKEYADTMNLAKLAMDCISLFTDDAFLAFFTQGGEPSAAASATTAAL